MWSSDTNALIAIIVCKLQLLLLLLALQINESRTIIPKWIMTVMGEYLELQSKQTGVSISSYYIHIRLFKGRMISDFFSKKNVPAPLYCSIINHKYYHWTVLNQERRKLFFYRKESVCSHPRLMCWGPACALSVGPGRHQQGHLPRGCGGPSGRSQVVSRRKQQAVRGGGAAPAHVRQLCAQCRAVRDHHAKMGQVATQQTHRNSVIITRLCDV